MPSWQDPAVQLFCAHLAIFIKHVGIGCYYWEFLLSFRFDWEHMTGRRPMRWTLVAYFTARYALLVELALAAIVSNQYVQLGDCTAWTQGMFAMAHISIAASSLLLALRVVAYSEHKPWVYALLGVCWLVQVAMLIHGVVKINAFYLPVLYFCGVTHTTQSRYNVFSSLIFEGFCALISLWFLRRNKGGALWNLLFTQGLIWLAVAAVAWIPVSILLALDLNDGMNLAFLTQALITVVICATRMYRDLLQFDDKNETSFTMTQTGIGWQRSRPHEISVVITEDFTDEDSTTRPPYAERSMKSASVGLRETRDKLSTDAV